MSKSNDLRGKVTKNAWIPLLLQGRKNQPAIQRAIDEEEARKKLARMNQQRFK